MQFACPRCGLVAEGDPSTLVCTHCGYPGPDSRTPTQWGVTARYSPARGLWTTGVVLLSVYCVLAIVASFQFTFPVGSTAQRMLGLVGNLGSAAQLAFVVVFLVWVHRVATNARVLDSSAFQYSVGWTTWCWVIPLANYFLAYPPMRELWQKTMPKRGHGPLLAWFIAWGGAAVVGVVATGFAFVQVFSAIVGNMQRRGANPGAVDSAFAGFAPAFMVVAAANLVAAILLMVATSQLQAGQEAQASRQTQAGITP